MALIPKQKALLAVCTALNPFVNFDLLRTVPGGGREPIPNVGDVRIGDVLRQLNFHDQKFGLHVIDFIVKTIIAECRDAGFAIALGPGELVEEPVPTTVGDFAMVVRGGSRRV